MTRLTTTEVDCPKCNKSFKILWEASINTWMDPDLIQKVIDDAYYYKCPNCKDQIHLTTKILINCPKGMFWISNDKNLETKMKILRDYEVIDKDGNIASPNLADNPPNGNLGPSFKTVLDSLKDLKDTLETTNSVDNLDKISDTKVAKIFRKIEESKDKLLGDEDLTENDFVNGLESLMDKIMDGLEGKKKEKE